MAVVAAGLMALAVFVAVSAVMQPRMPARVLERLRAARGRPDGRPEPVQRRRSFAERVGPGTGAWLRDLGARPLPSRIVAGVETRFRQAGSPITPAAFLSWLGVMAVLGLAVLALAIGSGQRGAIVLLLAFLALMLAALPLVWLRSSVQARQKAVLKALPDALDLIVTTVEAWMSVEAALTEVGNETAGPLGEELRLAMREIALGRSRRDALLRMIDRAPVAEFKSFVHALIQAQETGIPVGQVLRTQAEEVRVRKRQRAEAEAGKAPVKLVVVLVFLVMPTMIVFMLRPAVIRFLEQAK